MKRAVFLALAGSTMLGGAISVVNANDTPELILPPASAGSAEALAVSPDGTVIVGQLKGQAIVWDYQVHQWNSGDPFKSPTATLGGSSSIARAISTSTLQAGRHTIVGDAYTPEGEQRGFVASYNANSGLFFSLQDIGTLNGGTYVSARGISESDRMIVGFARDGVTNKIQAIRISADDVINGVPDAMESLGALGGFGHSRAYGISGDGTVIVGSSSTDTSGIYSEAVMWTAPNQGVTLGKINNGDASDALAADFYGDVIVGWATDGSDQAAKAFRWTESTGMESLGTLDGDTSSRALGISSNGAVIVGASAAPGSSKAFRWSEASGMLSVEEWLVESGATLANLDLTSSANGANVDGSVVVGQTVDGYMFIARGKADVDNPGDTGDTGGSGGSGGSGDTGDTGGSGDTGDTGDTGGTGGTGGTGDTDAGMITVDDLGNSLSSTGATTSSALSGMSVLLNGAGGRPLDRLTDTGRSIFWATGDLGISDNSPSDGGFGLGEVGFGRNFGHFQVNAALGFARQDYDAALGGQTTTNSFYGKAEVLAQLYGDDDSGIWAVVSGAAAVGSAQLQRNYVANGGLIATSTGDSNVEAYGVRGRLQWHNAFPFVSPFAEVSWSQACIDGYTETGGPFPASFAGQCDNETLARYGVDVTVPVNERLRVTGTLSGVHRIGGSVSNVNGQIIGLQTFSVPGMDRPNNWVRAGAGFEADLNEHTTMSFMANGTTGDGASNGWITTSIKRRF